jgi:flagellin-like protein
MKAISPVLAVLMMIAIAIAGSLITYAWVTGYIGFTTEKAGQAIMIQSVANDGNDLKVYVQNVGEGAVELAEDSSLYVDGGLVGCSIDGATGGKLVLGEKNTATLTVANGAAEAGEKKTVKVTSSLGTFSEKSEYPAETSGGGSSGSTNNAPILDYIGDKSVEETNLLTFTATASDADVGDVLTFSLTGAVPTGASITSGGVFTWTPTVGQGPDDYTFSVRVTDDGSPIKYDSETITVTVTEAGSGNTAPVLGAIGDKAVNELAELSFTATATDSDIPAQTLTFSLGGGAPTGASIDPSTGVFTWTPAEAQGPDAPSITIIVSDGIAQDSETITVTVDEVNVAPVLGTIGDKSVDEGTELSFTATASDADLPANTLTYSLIGAPAGASIDSSTGVFTWTPADDTDATFTVRVTDNGSPVLYDEEEITVTVNSVVTQQTIFSDDFENNNFKPEWNTNYYASISSDESHSPTRSARIRGTYYGGDDGAITLEISTAGYTTIEVSFWRMFEQSSYYDSTTDNFRVEWRVGTSGSWTQLGSTLTDDASWDDATFSLSGADNQPTIQIRFSLSDCEDSDSAYIDNVVVTGFQ